MPAGLGKTRILLGLACLLKSIGFNTIRVAYPNELLLSQERHNLVKVQTFLGEDCFEFFVAKEEKDIRRDRRFNTALIMEEADWMLLDKGWNPCAKFVVALTATVQESQNPTESLLLRKRGFFLLDAGFAKNDAVVNTVDDVKEFFERTKGMPRLVFCAPGLVTRDDLMCDILDEIRKKETLNVSAETDLTKLQNMQPGDVVVHTTEEWFRGVDYNTAHPDGIALLIAKPFSSERAYLQALGRVGRYATNCERFILSETARVN